MVKSKVFIVRQWYRDPEQYIENTQTNRYFDIASESFAFGKAFYSSMDNVAPSKVN